MAPTDSTEASVLSEVVHRVSHMSMETARNPSPHRGLLLLLMDVVFGILIIGTVVAFVVAIPATVASGPVLIVLGIWTALVTIWAVPGLVVLYLSPPVTPLRERSALIASATWFGRSLWSGVVFVASILLGTVTGLVASRIGDSESNLGSAMGSVFGTMAQLALWPFLATVAGVAFVIMGIRWLVDLRVISERGGAHEVLLGLQRRWFGAENSSASDSRVGATLSFLAASLVGRVGLVLLLLTVLLDVVITFSIVAGSD